MQKAVSPDPPAARLSGRGALDLPDSRRIVTFATNPPERESAPSGFRCDCSPPARLVGFVRTCSGLYRFGRSVRGRCRPASYLVGVIVGGRICSGLYRFVRGVRGRLRPAPYLVGVIVGGRTWSDLFGFVQVCSGCLGPASACVLSGRGGYAWSGLVGAVRFCSGLVGFGRGALLGRGGRRWTPAGLLFCCVERRYHGVDEMGRGAALGAVLGEIPAASAGMTEVAAGTTADGASDGGG